MEGQARDKYELTIPLEEGAETIQRTHTHGSEQGDQEIKPETSVTYSKNMNGEESPFKTDGSESGSPVLATFLSQ